MPRSNGCRAARARTRRSPRPGSVRTSAWSAASAATPTPTRRLPGSARPEPARGARGRRADGHRDHPRRRRRRERDRRRARRQRTTWAGSPSTGNVLCQLEIPDEAVREARAQAQWLCVNAAPARPLVVDADLVVVNRYEAEVVGEQPLIAVTLGRRARYCSSTARKSHAPGRRASRPSTEPPPATPSPRASSSRCSKAASPRRRSAARARQAPSPRPASARSRHCRPLPR